MAKLNTIVEILGRNPEDVENAKKEKKEKCCLNHNLKPLWLQTEIP